MFSSRECSNFAEFCAKSQTVGYYKFSTCNFALFRTLIFFTFVLLFYQIREVWSLPGRILCSIVDRLTSTGGSDIFHFYICHSFRIRSADFITRDFFPDTDLCWKSQGFRYSYPNRILNLFVSILWIPTEYTSNVFSIYLHEILKTNGRHQQPFKSTAYSDRPTYITRAWVLPRAKWFILIRTSCFEFFHFRKASSHTWLFDIWFIECATTTERPALVRSSRAAFVPINLLLQLEMHFIFRFPYLSCGFLSRVLAII